MKKYIWIVVAIIVLAIIGVYAVGLRSKNNPTSTNTETQPSQGSESKLVEITDFAFNPNNLEVRLGEIVTFKNNDSVQHTVTADNGEFNLQANPGDSVKITFDKSGTIKYHCTLHPSMTGTVTVK